MPTLHLMIGLPASGKTTYARALAERERALLLTPDEWQIRLTGADMFRPDHDRIHSCIEQIMWDVAARALQLGANVILDFGCWAREERDEFRRKTEALGAGFKLHYMDVPREELFRRLDIRNAQQPEGAFVIPRGEMEKYMQIFQPPEPGELA